MSGDFAARTIDEIEKLRQNDVAVVNVDSWRFAGGLQSLRQELSPDQSERTTDFIRSNADAVNTAAALLHDEESREWLRRVLTFRALGPEHVCLPTNTPHFWASYEQAKQWLHEVSAKRFPPFEFSRYEFKYRNSSLSLECWLGNVVFSFLLNQYQFNRNGIFVQAEPGDWVIDAGACFGDTAISFALAVGDAGKVFSFEAMPAHLEIIAENLRRNPGPASRIAVFDRALAEQSGRILRFVPNGAGSRAADDGTVEVMSIAIDDFVREQGLPRLDFIKMDIEGGEIAALRGAAQAIRRYKPKLAISVYHSLEDLVRIPALIREIEPDYELFLEHYTLHWEETVLYAVPSSRMTRM
jgi:FkbM family methyltransferase